MQIDMQIVRVCHGGICHGIFGTKPPHLCGLYCADHGQGDANENLAVDDKSDILVAR